MSGRRSRKRERTVQGKASRKRPGSNSPVKGNKRLEINRDHTERGKSKDRDDTEEDQDRSEQVEHEQVTGQLLKFTRWHTICHNYN